MAVAGESAASLLSGAFPLAEAVTVESERGQCLLGLLPGMMVDHKAATLADCMSHGPILRAFPLDLNQTSLTRPHAS